MKYLVTMEPVETAIPRGVPQEFARYGEQVILPVARFTISCFVESDVKNRFSALLSHHIAAFSSPQTSIPIWPKLRPHSLPPLPQSKVTGYGLITAVATSPGCSSAGVGG